MRRGWAVLIGGLFGGGMGIALTVLALRGCPAGLPWAHGSEFEQRKLQLLQEENTRLHGLVAAAGEIQDQANNQRLRQEVEREVAAIRGLAFKKPVHYEVLDRAQIKATIAGKLAEVFSPGEFEQTGAAFARLGLLEPNYPLREKYIELLGEQVAAFYDQHKHQLVMFRDASLENAQNRVVLAHELTHALQDQHFGLAKLPLEIKTNDDQAVAASSLCEGDATLVMTQYMLSKISLSSLKDNLTASLAQNTEKLASAPRFLRELLVFPYLRGQEFCTALSAADGFDSINRAYSKLPASSAEILHPERYLAQTYQAPMLIEWKDLKVQGQSPVVDNVLGEFSLRLLLSEGEAPEKAETLAAGWRGDRYLSYQNGDALVWQTAWVSPQQATQFLETHRATLSKRYQTNPNRSVRWVTPAPNQVLLIDAPTTEWAQALAQKFSPRNPPQ